MNIFMYILLGLLIVCAISVTFSKNLLNSILIFMAYSLVMSIIWVLLESPDLAITEAAVGAGVTSILFFITLKKIHGVLQNPEEETADEAADADDEEETADASDADDEEETADASDSADEEAATDETADASDSDNDIQNKEGSV